MPYSLDSFLTALDGNAILVDRLVEAFMVEGPRLFGLLETAVRGGEPRDIARAAHTFKGAVSNYRYPELVEVLERVEQQADRGELAEISAALADIEGMLSEMLEHMRSRNSA